MKYLHETKEGILWLDHKVTPEVSACLCAQVSRVPIGGIRARYLQMVDAVAESLWEEHNRPHSWGELLASEDTQTVMTWREMGEDRLCEYPIHPRVQRFFDEFVGRYGHSSVLELTGRPAVFVENISWLTAWLLFDSPLCAGQEFSTRAVQHKNWPMARECLSGSDLDPDLMALHKDWFDVFEAEVVWWKQHLSDPENRKKLGIGDKEHFRPALDRARWALPGTIATGCSQTTGLRERARVLRDGSLLAQASKAPAAEAVWESIAKAYREAVPGIAGMGLREAVYGAESKIPGHLISMLDKTLDGPNVEVDCFFTKGLSKVHPYRRTKEKSYMDPAVNARCRVNLTIRCSLAVARDWHRHRTVYPWHLQVVRAPQSTGPGPIQIDSHYAPMSDFGIAKVPSLLRRSTEVYDKFMALGNMMQAALALPFGTRVCLSGQTGLRDAVYLLELRHKAEGANFEYKDQAGQALQLLSKALGSKHDI